MKVVKLAILFFLANIFFQSHALALDIGCTVNVTIIPADHTKSTCFVEESPGLDWTNYKLTYSWGYEGKTCGTSYFGGASGGGSPEYAYDSPYTETHSAASNHYWECTYMVDDEPLPDLWIRHDYAINYRVYVKTTSNPNWASYAHIQTNTPNLEWWDSWTAP